MGLVLWVSGDPARGGLFPPKLFSLYPRVLFGNTTKTQIVTSSIRGRPAHFYRKSWGGVGFVVYSGEEGLQFFPEHSSTAVTPGSLSTGSRGKGAEELSKGPYTLTSRKHGGGGALFQATCPKSTSDNYGCFFRHRDLSSPW